MVSYLLHAPRQAYQGATFGLIQSSVSTRLNIFIPVLQIALRAERFTPSRTLDELRARIKGQALSDDQKSTNTQIS